MAEVRKWFHAGFIHQVDSFRCVMALNMSLLTWCPNAYNFLRKRCFQFPGLKFQSFWPSIRKTTFVTGHTPWEKQYEDNQKLNSLPRFFDVEFEITRIFMIPFPEHSDLFESYKRLVLCLNFFSWQRSIWFVRVSMARPSRDEYNLVNICWRTCINAAAKQS